MLYLLLLQRIREEKCATAFQYDIQVIQIITGALVDVCGANVTRTDIYYRHAGRPSVQRSLMVHGAPKMRSKYIMSDRSATRDNKK